MKKLIAVAITLLSLPALPSPAEACGWTTSSGVEIDFGSMCEESTATAPTPTTIPTAPVQTQQSSTVKICNDTSSYIQLVISSANSTGRLTEGMFLLENEKCLTREVLSGPNEAFHVRAWGLHSGAVLTNNGTSFCAETDTYHQQNSATTEAECDRVAGGTEWVSFQFYRMARDGSRDISISH